MGCANVVAEARAALAALDAVRSRTCDAGAVEGAAGLWHHPDRDPRLWSYSRAPASGHWLARLSGWGLRWHCPSRKCWRDPPVGTSHRAEPTSRPWCRSHFRKGPGETRPQQGVGLGVPWGAERRCQGESGDRRSGASVQVGWAGGRPDQRHLSGPGEGVGSMWAHRLGGCGLETGGWAGARGPRAAGALVSRCPRSGSWLLPGPGA